MRFILFLFLALFLLSASPARAWNPREPSTACNGNGIAADVGVLTPERKKQIIAQEEAKLAELRKEASHGDQAATIGLCTQRYITFTTPDYTDIVSWCRKAAGKGNPEALNQLGIYYRDGLGVQQDYAQAVKLWLQAAAHPEPFSMTPSCELAFMYAEGKGVKQDWSEAYYWGTLYSLAMGYHERTHPLDTARYLTPEQIQLVNKRVAERASHDPLLREALRKEQIRARQAAAIEAKAQQWHPLVQELASLRARAKRGDAQAQLKLGTLYSGGQGVPPNRTEAMKWLRMAADQGVAQAQFALGCFYQIGKKEDRNYVAAAQLFRKAAEQGIPQAQNNLGALYSFGQGVKQDKAEAVKWWRKAADKTGGQSASAAFNLGEAYLHGLGVKQDYQEAYYWLSVGATEENSRQALHEARKHLTSEQAEIVDLRVQSWVTYVRSHPYRAEGSR